MVNGTCLDINECEEFSQPPCSQVRKIFEFLSLIYDIFLTCQKPLGNFSKSRWAKMGTRGRKFQLRKDSTEQELQLSIGNSIIIKLHIFSRRTMLPANRGLHLIEFSENSIVTKLLEMVTYIYNTI